MIREKAMVYMIMPMRVSRIRQAVGFLKTGASICPQKLKEKNQINDTDTAPTPKKRRPWPLNCPPILPIKSSVSM